MQTSIDSSLLTQYLKSQLNHFFPDGRVAELDAITRRALERVELCFGPVRLPMYRRTDDVYFNHLHSDQYATFLYLASNCAWEAGDDETASKLYCLNKALNGFMCMYDTALPVHFLIIHTVGMLLGKAEYGDFFVAIHGATVGTDRESHPRFGEGVVICGGASIIGDCEVGANVSVSVDTLIRNQSVPSDHVVAGRSPSLVCKPARRSLINVYFNVSAS